LLAALLLAIPLSPDSRVVKPLAAASSPAALPGTVQAEDFDDGASGVAYRDTTLGNSGGQYRSTDVDIEACSDSGGGYNLGWVFAGEWLNYTVNVAAAGSYDLEFRVASGGAGGTFHLEVNGVNKTGSLTVPNTGGWQAWTTIRKTGVSLSAGQQLWRLVMETNGATTAVGNFNYFRATSSSGSPYGGVAASLPGTLEAETFDEGGPGISFGDTTPENSGGQYRATAVDIEATSDAGSGYDVGWVFAGEWLKYSVNVTTAGAYDLEFRVASAGAGGTFHLEVNGADLTGPLVAPNTGGWQAWATLRKTGVTLTAGPQAWRLVMDGNGSTGAVANFNYVRVTSGAGGSTPYGGAPVALPGIIQAENFDQGAAGVAYVDNTPSNDGGQYRSTAVDIEPTSDAGGGYDIGWAFAGEWLNYSVSVGTAGTYDLDVRVASGGAGGTFHIEVNGVDKTGPLTVPNTGGWQTWTTIRKPGVPLSAGPQVLRLVMNANGATTAVGNFNWIRVSTPNGLTILRGPYLQQVTDTGAIVVWTTRDLGTAQVRYAVSGGTTTSVTANARLFPASDTGLASDFYQYEARITGLSATTRYTYDVFMGGADATTGQDTFTTAPADGSGTVRFIAFGDSGVGSTSQGQLAARMATDTFDLALHTGDVAYGTSTGIGGPSYTQYDNWVFGVYQWMRSRPFYPSIGNHDDEINHASAYRDVFVLPEQGASTTYPDNAERYYSFDYGPVHFVALDTEYALLDPGRQQAQLAWLDADLAGTAQPWRVVYFHRSPYSSGTVHGSALDVRQAFAPILERRGVQLVLSSHDHDYERSTPWREFVANGSAITYVVTGGGGAPLYTVGTSPWTARSASLNEYVRVTAANCVMTLEAVGLDGAVFDQASIDRCAAANQPPQVSLTAPQSGGSYSAPGTVSMSATANDDVAVTRVEFYAGTTLLNTDRSAPYAYTWSNAQAGTYDVRAVAYDGTGASATSAAATIIVAAASLPTAVSFHASSDHATLVTRYELRIFASSADPNTASALSTSDLGKPTPDAAGDITVDRSALFSALAPGNYVAAVAAIGTGGSSTSTGVAFSR
jgi:Carbohydrate binding module (family 6)/Bacterial Ig domain/Calcineurin-like phosphoesterase/Purple acid Phosphatase, N-terminal domain